MRQLANTNSDNPTPIFFVPMRGKYDCLTCVTAMLLGIKYEDVEKSFGGNIDPTKDPADEAQRMYTAFRILIEKHNRAILELFAVPPIRGGRRYFITVRIDDPNQPLSQIMTHSIVVDEAGRVFDPNPQYGEFDSLAQWRAAMALPHNLEAATEIFEYSL